jgi:hypothetical protein
LPAESIWERVLSEVAPVIVQARDVGVGIVARREVFRR